MSQDSDDLTTQPTATALMERVREVEVRLARDIGALAARLDDQTARSEAQTARLEAQFSVLREEMIKGFYKLNSRVLSLAEDMLDIKANEREILKRLFDPEITEKTS